MTYNRLEYFQKCNISKISIHLLPFGFSITFTTVIYCHDKKCTFKRTHYSIICFPIILQRRLNGSVCVWGRCQPWKSVRDRSAPSHNASSQHTLIYSISTTISHSCSSSSQGAKGKNSSHKASSQHSLIYSISTIISLLLLLPFHLLGYQIWFVLILPAYTHIPSSTPSPIPAPFLLKMPKVPTSLHASSQHKLLIYPTSFSSSLIPAFHKTTHLFAYLCKKKTLK